MKKEHTAGDILRYRFFMDLHRGLYSAPAAELVNLLNSFTSNVTISNITKRTHPVNARSLNKITLSNISQGDEVEITVCGADADVVIDSVKQLVESAFNNISPHSYRGKKVLSHGVAVGQLVWEDSAIYDIPKSNIANSDEEISKLDTALDAVHQALSDARERLISQGLHDEAAIFEAHMLILMDSEVLSSVKEQIREENLNAAYVYKNKMTGLADEFRKLSNEYMRERASDLLDIAKQVLARLNGNVKEPHAEYGDVILAAHEVTPSLISRWNPKQLKGVITEVGGNSSHVAVLARALNIPAVSGCKINMKANGTKVVMDTSSMEIIVNPPENVWADFEEKYSRWQEQLICEQKASQGEACTIDGHKVSVYGNVGDITTAESALRNGAEGIGLLRTEFLYMNRRHQPTENAQAMALKDIFALFQSMPIIVRTLDVGGDKAVPWVASGDDGTMLGVRGVRLYSKYKDFTITHLKAILRAGFGYDLRVMIPMVSVPEEVKFAKELLEMAHNKLVAEGTEHKWPVHFGVMIETPSAVLMADELAEIVDFFSIGTNDLCQYIMAAERGSKSLEELLEPMQPPVLRAIKVVADAAHKHNIDLSVCGEMAGDPVMARILVGMGVKSLSMNGCAIGAVKRMIREQSLELIRKTASDALKAHSLADSKNIITEK